jgi:hypothetical protein
MPELSTSQMGCSASPDIITTVFGENPTLQQVYAHRQVDIPEVGTAANIGSADYAKRCNFENRVVEARRRRGSAVFVEYNP